MFPSAVRVCSQQGIDFVKGPALGVNSAVQKPNSALSETLTPNEASKTLAKRECSVESKPYLHVEDFNFN